MKFEKHAFRRDSKPVSLGMLQYAHARVINPRKEEDIMPTVEEVEQQILSVEGFSAEFREAKLPNKKVNGRHGLMRHYPYVRKAPGSWSLNYWATTRFFKFFSKSDFDVWGYNKHGTCCQGSTLLSTLRGK
jgi:hypothetical protein